VRRTAVAQGTIKEYDDKGKTGSLLMDDRREVAIEATSVGDPVIRTLRIGQRVKFDLDEAEGALVARDLRIVTFE
jgi:cold shock CspA family protein